MTETKKTVEQLQLYAKINAALEIEVEFNSLFNVLDLIPSEQKSTIEKRDVVNILQTFKNMQIFKGEKEGICDKKGEPV